jgi:hypothetical protein
MPLAGSPFYFVREWLLRDGRSRLTRDAAAGVSNYDARRVLRTGLPFAAVP